MIGQQSIYAILHIFLCDFERDLGDIFRIKIHKLIEFL